MATIIVQVLVIILMMIVVNVIAMVKDIQVIVVHMGHVIVKKDSLAINVESVHQAILDSQIATSVYINYFYVFKLF